MKSSSLIRIASCALALGSAAASAQDLAAQLGAYDDAPFEGAIGLDLAYRPEIPGAKKREFGYRPVIYLRYGRLTLSSASGFVNKRSDGVARGLGIDIVRSETLRIGLGLRYDGGRSEEASERLRGLGDIPATLRARASINWWPGGPWRFGASWSPDAFGRGGGDHGVIDAAWDRRLSPVSVLTLGAGLGLANQAYMQSYHGITVEQSERTGYPVHIAKAGLRELTMSASVRRSLGERWSLLGSVGVSRLLGSAADSPLTEDPLGWSLNTAFAWRF